MTIIKMHITALLAAATIGLFFAIGMVSAHYGKNVESRFLERGTLYTASDLKDLSPEEAHGYVWPVLFPLDFMFMILLGGFLGLASIETADSIPALRRFDWLFVVIPAIYVVADLTEDTLLAHMLMKFDVASHNEIYLARIVTKAKLVAATLAVLQTILLAGLAILFDLVRAGITGNR
jgi:hypothetical protein